MKISRGAVLLLFSSVVVAACGGGSSSPTEPASPTPTPTAVPTFVPTATPAPTPTPLPAAPIQGFVQSSKPSSPIYGVYITVTQNGQSFLATSDLNGFYRVDGPVVGPAQILASPGRGCADVILNVQLHAATNEINIQICP